MMYQTSTMRSHSSPAGFTLVELIVSIGIFMIVVTIALSAYVSLIALDRKARALNDVVTNLSFVVDSMSRSIRTGTNYQCAGGTNCPSGGTSFGFTNENSQQVFYRLKADGTIGSCIGTASCTDSNASSLTDPRVSVTRLTFYTQGVGTSDGVQPRVVFTMTGSITPSVGATPISFTIESAATERLIEI